MTEPLDVLKRTLEIIRERGWSPTYAQDKHQPLCIRHAVAVACTDLTGVQTTAAWYQLYTTTTTALREFLGTGPSSWEFSVKHQSEVEQALEDTIAWQVHLKGHADVL